VAWDFLRIYASGWKPSRTILMQMSLTTDSIPGLQSPVVPVALRTPSTLSRRFSKRSVDGGSKLTRVLDLSLASKGHPNAADFEKAIRDATLLLSRDEMHDVRFVQVFREGGNWLAAFDLRPLQTAERMALAEEHEA
jgi:hypothetical protein